jgi:hypothetical protein
VALAAEAHLGGHLQRVLRHPGLGAHGRARAQHPEVEVPPQPEGISRVRLRDPPARAIGQWIVNGSCSYCVIECREPCSYYVCVLCLNWSSRNRVCVVCVIDSRESCSYCVCE